MRFVPSKYSYGAEEAAEASTPVDTDTAAAAGGSFVRKLLGLDDDARTEVKDIESKIANYQLMAQKQPLLRNIYVMEIKKLQNRLAVVQSQATEQSISDKSIVATKVGVSVLTIAGIGVVGLVGYNLWLSSKYIKSRM